MVIETKLFLGFLKFLTSALSTPWTTISKSSKKYTWNNITWKQIIIHKLMANTMKKNYKFVMLNYIFKYSVQLSYSVLSDSVNPWIAAWGFLVHQQLRELAQTHVHQVSDAIQPSQPLSSPSPPAFNLSQHQGLFQWASSLHHVAKVLELQL